MRMGFELTRAENSGLAVHHLNHSPTPSTAVYTAYQKKLEFNIDCCSENVTKMSADQDEQSSDHTYRNQHWVTIIDTE